MSKLLTPEIVIASAALISLFVIGVLILFFNFTQPAENEVKDTGDTARLIIQPHLVVALAEPRILE